jgi:hypothetical protein
MNNNRQALIVALSLFILQAQFVLPSPTTSKRLVSKKKKESPFSDNGLFIGFTLLYLGQFF